MNEFLSKNDFTHIYEGILPTLSKETQRFVPSKEDCVNKIFINGNIVTIGRLYEIVEKEDNNFIKIIIYRIIAVTQLINDFHSNGQLSRHLSSLKEAWSLVYKSLISLQKTDVFATIGSQGFLSIPLYHNQQGSSFEFLRLHIWDTSLENYINKEKTNLFTIHSHQFHAQSRILCGKLTNENYSVANSDNWTKHSFFEIIWNNLENVNQKTSKAINSKQFVKVEKKDECVYTSNGCYEILAGNFHSSRACIGMLTATLFFFSTNKGRVDQSFVIGPSEIAESEVNRKIEINPYPIIEELNKIINNEGRN